MGSSTTRRATALPADARRAAIVEAALPLLRERGERVTSRQIAEAAGIAEGTVFRVFTDKDELIHAALDSALDPAPFEQAIGEIDPALPFELRLVAATEVIQRRVVDVWTILSRLGPAARSYASRPMEDSRALIAIFESDPDHIRVEPVVAARMLRALTLSLTHPMIAGEPTGADEIVTTLLHGIAADSGGRSA